MVRVGEFFASGFSSPAEGLFADDFVFHYYNSQLPELTGDYEGLEGMLDFFKRIHTESGGTFRTTPVSTTPFGDELVAAFATHTLTIAAADLEVDALVVWRVVDGQIREAWDIPAVNTARTKATALGRRSDALPAGGTQRMAESWQAPAQVAQRNRLGSSQQAETDDTRSR